jgi:predicted phosphodiesterase
MPNPALSDADFIETFERLGAGPMSRKLGMAERGIIARRERLETKYQRQLTSPNPRTTRSNIQHPHRVAIEVKNGTVLVGSDAHYWPGPASTAHRAFVQFTKEMKPAVVVMNGDAIDAATISRHPPIGWEKRPPLIDEIEAAQERLHEIEKAAGRARKVWTLGNHDGRFETRIATVAPEFAKIHGVHLRDHFPLWEPCWGAWVNDNVVIKHRFKGGLHAPSNNTLWSGRTMVTGHLHSAKVQPITDYNGTRYGVDTGCLADPDAKAFVDYSEDNPKNWRSGFAVLTFKGGQLLQPELALVWDQSHIQFRGEIIKV